MVKDIALARNDFPILQEKINDEPLTYLDNAATTQKPRAVIAALTRFYEHDNANVARGVYTLAQRATSQFEAGRSAIAHWLGASADEIIFTRGTTTSLNWLAQSWAPLCVQPGDEIIISVMEHHSNLVPWQQAAQRLGAKLRYIELTDDGKLDLQQYQQLLNPRTKIVAITQVSNVLGTINPIKKMTQMAHDCGAYMIVDGAQAAGHFPVDGSRLDCDFYALSAHKIYGPTGLGILYGKKALLAKMPPSEFGGEMINLVTRQKTDFKPAPAKFEAGTLPIAQVIGFHAALRYLRQFNPAKLRHHEQTLVQSAYQQLAEIPGVQVYGPSLGEERGPVLAFNLEGVHPHDLATVLDTQGIAIRAGHHCVQPLMQDLGVNATARASFAIYNNQKDVQRLVEAVRLAKGFFER